MSLLRERHAWLGLNETFFLKCSQSYMMMMLFFLFGNTYFLYDQFSHFPFSFSILLIYISNEQEQRNGSGCEGTFQHESTHTCPHHFTTNLSASGIIPIHLTGPKCACCVLEQPHTRPVSAQITTLSSPVDNRKTICLIHILNTSGKPSTSQCKHQQHRPPVTSGWEFQLASLM